VCRVIVIVRPHFADANPAKIHAGHANRRAIVREMLSHIDSDPIHSLTIPSNVQVIFTLW